MSLTLKPLRPSVQWLGEPDLAFPAGSPTSTPRSASRPPARGHWTSPTTPHR